VLVCMGWLRTCVISLALIAAGAQAGLSQTEGLRYEPSRLGSYSNTELIWLLSRSSIDLNLRDRAHEGVVLLTPSLVLGQHRRPSSDTVTKTATIPVHRDSGLFYIDVVISQLVQRRAYRELLQAFDTSRDLVQLSWLEHVFASLRGPEADSGLRPYATMPDSGETQYFALKYFAEGGTRWSFDILNCHQYTVSSLEWADIVSLFGHFRYYPASANLAGELDMASLNLDVAAEEALRALYPEAQPQYHSPEEARKYWTRYVAEHQKPRYARSKCHSSGSQ
jgi:hypothetical protein